MVILECPASDRAYFQELASEGHDVTVIDVERYEGTEEIIEVIINLTPTLIPILIAHLSHFSRQKSMRKVIVDGQRKILEKCSPFEIEQLLSAK